MKDFFDRLLKIIWMDSSVFDELADKPDLISQSLFVVLLYSAASGIGAVGKIGITGILIGSIGSLINWSIWVYLIYSAARLWGGSIRPTSTGEFMRAIGFASAPGIIRILGISGDIRVFSNIAATIWMTAAMACAVKKIFGYRDLIRPVILCAGGWFLTIGAAYILSFAFRSAGF